MESIQQQIIADTEFLKKNNIIDYSLLVGIHNLEKEKMTETIPVNRMLSLGLSPYPKPGNNPQPGGLSNTNVKKPYYYRTDTGAKSDIGVTNPLYERLNLANDNENGVIVNNSRMSNLNFELNVSENSESGCNASTGHPPIRHPFEDVIIL